MAKLYAYLLSLTVTVHISSNQPTMQNHKAYGISTCSAVFVSPNEVLTAGHCMLDSRGHQWVKLSTGESYPAIQEKVSYVDDLALLRVQYLSSHEYAKLGRVPEITDKVYTVNSGDDYEKTWNQGVVSNVVDTDYSTRPMIAHTAQILFGASGSGLFDKKGRLVGINTIRNPIFGFAVNTDTVREFLHPDEINAN